MIKKNRRIPETAIKKELNKRRESLISIDTFKSRQLMQG